MSLMGRWKASMQHYNWTVRLRHVTRVTNDFDIGLIIPSLPCKIKPDSSLLCPTMVWQVDSALPGRARCQILQHILVGGGDLERGSG